MRFCCSLSWNLRSVMRCTHLLGAARDMREEIFARSPPAHHSLAHGVEAAEVLLVDDGLDEVVVVLEHLRGARVAARH